MSVTVVRVWYRCPVCATRVGVLGTHHQTPTCPHGGTVHYRKPKVDMTPETIE